MTDDRLLLVLWLGGGLLLGATLLLWCGYRARGRRVRELEGERDSGAW